MRDTRERSQLVDEFTRQRRAGEGPRIAATLGSLGDFAVALRSCSPTLGPTSVFSRCWYERTGDGSPQVNQHSALALDATSERLSELRLNLAEVRLHPQAETTSQSDGMADLIDEDGAAFYVLDDELQIVLAWTAGDQRRLALTGLRVRLASDCPRRSRKQSAACLWVGRINPESREAGIARPVPFLVAGRSPVGPAGLFIGVRIDRVASPNS